MLFTTTLSTPLILGLGLAFVASSLSRDTPAAQGLTGVVTTSSITATQWSELNSTLGGKLSAATPFAAPCFDVVNGASNEDKSGCAAIQSGYRDPFYRASRFNAFLWPAWEGCTALEETCQLDPSSTNNSIAWEGKNCAQGSLSEYFVEASSPQDVQNVLRFVRDTGVLVSIKNSGHDFGGRGAQIGSLSIWTHNLNTISHDPSFVPEGALEYTGGTSVLTLGAGVSFYSAYEFADAHNLTVVGGYHPTVGASGGWLMGGGHSILSPVFGLGVDRVLQFKIVTPDGNYLTVNEFLHPDLFWALRGGGGGTFGVVIESTIKVEPKMKLQVASLSFTQNSDNARGFLKLVIDNSVKWGKAGWGGHISPRNLVSVTPLLSLQEAQESMKDAVDYTLSQNGTAVIEELPSWLAFFNKYVKSSAIGGYNAIGGAWLMPNTLFDSEQTKEQLLDALMRMLTAGNPHITTATPYLYDYAEGTTSAAPAWRNSLWHAVFQYEFPWNATIDGVGEHFQTITDNIQNLRDLSPESGAYGTEGDIYELDHERAFWGDNYPKLLELKQKYDPNGILDCWKCVGWRGPSDPRYKCYVDAQKSATDLF